MLNLNQQQQQQLTQLSQQIQHLLSATPYTPQPHHHISIKSHLQSLLTSTAADHLTNFILYCSLLSSAATASSPLLTWIPHHLSAAAASSLRSLSISIYSDERKLVLDLIPKLLPLIKETIKGSSIDGDDDGDEVTAASSRSPLDFAILAAYQLRWLVTQVERPELGKLCGVVVPCGLTALDHWSPEVKGQGMISFIHLAKNVNAVELGCFGDVILDACHQNVVSSDELWHLAVEMSVLLVTCLQRENPRSSWFEKLLNEMLGHLERQPRDKERRIAWLKQIEPFLCCVGLVLLAHFRRLFPLFFQWMHADDDETVVLVLKRILAVVKLTWIRSSPYTTRLVDELAILYKEASLRTAREEIRTCIFQILILLEQCKSSQFETSWEKYKDDLNLTPLTQSIAGSAATRLGRYEANTFAIYTTCGMGGMEPHI